MSIQDLICGFKSAIVDYLTVHHGNKVLSSEQLQLKNKILKEVVPKIRLVSYIAH